MQHKAKGHRQSNVKTPGNRPPVKQWVGRSPILYSSHLLNMRLIRIQSPFNQRIKENVCRHCRCKNHGSPCKGGIQGFSFSQSDLSISGKSDIDCAEKYANTQYRIIYSAFISKKSTDNLQNYRRLPRKYHKNSTKRTNSQKWYDY